jgi:ribonuclease BN (tRNA processing enzyme)
VKLTILGVSSGGVPAGSGYLLAEGSTKLLVDFGNGVLTELHRHVKLEDVTGVFLSHLHADHCQDVLPFALFRRFRGKSRLPVYGPPGTRTLLYRWFTLFHKHPDPYVEALDIVEVKPWEAYDLGALRIQASPVEHNVPSFALRAQPKGSEKLFVYSSDTKASALLVEAAMSADLLLAEATYQDLPPGKEPEATREHHMTAREAGEVARKAGAKRLMLTHVQYFLDAEVSRAQAREAYGGEVEIARTGASVEI